MSQLTQVDAVETALPDFGPVRNGNATPETPWPNCTLPAFTSSFLRNMICEKTNSVK